MLFQMTCVIVPLEDSENPFPVPFSKTGRGGSKAMCDELLDFPYFVEVLKTTNEHEGYTFLIKPSLS